jgi:hypothetical protein
VSGIPGRPDEHVESAAAWTRPFACEEVDLDDVQRRRRSVEEKRRQSTVDKDAVDDEEEKGKILDIRYLQFSISLFLVLFLLFNRKLKRLKE